MNRSLSESDLSELCGASISAPSPDDLAHRSLTPSDDDQSQFQNESNTGKKCNLILYVQWGSDLGTSPDYKWLIVASSSNGLLFKPWLEY